MACGTFPAFDEAAFEMVPEPGTELLGAHRRRVGAAAERRMGRRQPRLGLSGRGDRQGFGPYRASNRAALIALPRPAESARQKSRTCPS